MLDTIRRFVSHRMTPTEPAPVEGSGARPMPIRVAACALMLELAHADDEFSESERSHIQNALCRHFALDEATAQELMVLAEEERRQAVDAFQFTRLINETYDLGQKVVLAEVFWGVALADGKLAEHESYFVRKIANLLHIEPGYLNQARRTAASHRLGEETH